MLEISELGLYRRSDADVMFVPVFEPRLKEAEEAASPGNGKCHAPEFAEHLIPLLQGDRAETGRRPRSSSKMASRRA
jgi:hypothetical protein